ncbi:MAG: SMC-Scp complex subunit ScpB [Pseudomonadota bacterium]
MTPLETAMTDDSNTDDIRQAVRQLSFAYQRSAKEHRDAVEDVMADALRRAEAVLFSAGEPLSAAQIAETLPQGVEPAKVLMELKRTYTGRGVQLIEVAGKWRFQTAPDLAFLFVEERIQQKKLSQAALETLAIIAYGQPVTRAEIEAVRGVAVSKGVLDTLMEAGWVRVKGRRKTPGRPATFGTTDKFLEHFGLENLSVLPGKAELEAEGLLSDVIPDGFQAEADDLPVADSDDLLRLDSTETGESPDFVTDFLDEAAE